MDNSPVKPTKRAKRAQPEALANVKDEMRKRRAIPRDDAEKYRRFREALAEREREAALWKQAHAKDFNAAISVLQRDGKVPTNKPFTKGGQMGVQYMRYCGVGHDVNYDGQWSCSKSHKTKEGTKHFETHYGEADIKKLIERPKKSLQDMAKHYGLKYTTKMTKKDLAELIAPHINEKTKKLTPEKKPRKKAE